MSDLRKNCNQGQQKQTLRISSPPRLLDCPKTPACLGLILSQKFLTFFLESDKGAFLFYTDKKEGLIIIPKYCLHRM